MHRGTAPCDETPAGLRAGVLLGFVVVILGSLSGCGWGVADPVVSERVIERERRTPAVGAVMRYVPAPTASAASPLPDPRCRAARRLFLRAAIAPAQTPMTIDADTERLLDHVSVLAEGDDLADIQAVRELVDRFRDDPSSLSSDDLEDTVDRMDRLLVWAVTVCPPPQRPVWACSTQLTFGRPNPFDGNYFVEVGQLVPEAALDATLGEVPGNRIELTRSRNRVIYAWLDGFGLVRRRAEVRRLYDLWYVAGARRCDDQLPRPHPLDTGEVIVEELPDVGDGPQYAETTTTTAPTTLPPPTTAPPPETRPPDSGVPLEPCRYDPGDTTDDYDSFGDYMARGGAETGCWDLLTPAGRECVANPPPGEFFSCFDL